MSRRRQYRARKIRSARATSAGYGAQHACKESCGTRETHALVVDHGQTWRPVCSSLFPEDPSPVAPFPGVLAIEPARGVAPRSFVPLFGLPLLTVAYPSELSVDRARAGGDAVTVTTAIETTADLSIFSGSSFSVHPDHFGAGATEKREPRKATIAVALAGAGFRVMRGRQMARQYGFLDLR